MLLPFLIVLLSQPSGGADSVLAVNSARNGAEAKLHHRKVALVLELDHIKAKPSEFYLVIDLQEAQVHLKSGGNLLRSSPITGSHLLHESPGSRPYQFISRIDPGTPEPGNHGLRLRGRQLPLDFFGRLVEGARTTSRLYFSPRLILQSAGVPANLEVSLIILRREDMKALGSALEQGASAFLIPDDDARE